jgi:hypothetical protein
MNSEEDFDELDYPGWMYRALVEDDLPWKCAKKMEFNEFDTNYTLHDSHWIGIFYNVAYQQSATLAILWDEFWLPNRIKETISPNSDRTFLFIKLTSVQEISTSNFDSSFVSFQRCIASWSVQIINGQKILGVDDVLGGQVNIIYDGEEQFLAIESSKKMLTI